MLRGENMNISSGWKKKAGVSMLLLVLLALAACGSVRSARSLQSEAKHTFGECTVVSKTETADRTVVVLHDTLQDFDYEYRSTMNDIDIDGTSFGSVPSTTNTFMENLKKKVIADAKTDLDTICSGSDMSYEIGEGNAEVLLIIYSASETDCIDAATACAEVLNQQNQNNRLDGMLIYAVGNESEKWYHNDYYGSVKLPDTDFRTPADERIDYYTEIARQQTDPKAVFLRVETGTFRDTGADLRRVVCTLGSDYPTEPDSPVTFYYFKAESGMEYYICDFNYYEEDHYNFSWYTNY